MPKITKITNVPSLQTPIRQTAAIVQNQWYDGWTGLACAAGGGTAKTDCRLIGLGIGQAVANEDLELRIIADNFDLTLTQTAVAGTPYFANMYLSPLFSDDSMQLQTTDPVYRTFLIEARSLKIMYRKTTAAGANATNLKIFYAKW